MATAPRGALSLAVGLSSASTAAPSPVDESGLDHLPSLIPPPSSFPSSDARAAYIDETRHPLALDPLEAEPLTASLRHRPASRPPERSGDLPADLVAGDERR